MLIILSAYTRLFAGEAELELIFETKIPSYNVEDENLEKALENLVKQTLEVNKKLSSLSFKGIIFDDAAAATQKLTSFKIHLKDAPFAVIIEALSDYFSTSVEFRNGIMIVRGRSSLGAAEGIWLLRLTKQTRQFLKISEGHEIESLNLFLNDINVRSELFRFKYDAKNPDYILCKGTNWDLKTLQSLAELASRGLVISKP